jgi:hypothetical protein
MSFGVATTHGVVPADVLARQVTVAFGGSRQSMDWRNYTYPVEQLLGLLADWKFGPKDGMCLTQGKLVASQRLASNVSKNYVLMLDMDTGETMDEIQAKIERAGLFAFLWHTYSHLKPTTTIAEAKYHAWCGKHKLKPGTGAVLIDGMKRYLASVGKIQQAVIDSITRVDREHKEGGIQYVVHHGPMARVRAMFILKDPFDFTDGTSQRETIVEWHDRYRGVAKMLGVACDRSCIDPSRLMYTPRVATGTDLSQFEMRVVGGGFLDLKNVDRVSDVDFDKPAISGAFSLSDMNVSEKKGPTLFKTPGLGEFVRKYTKNFDAARWMSGYTDVRAQNGDKYTFKCPNDDAHSNPGDPDDMGFFCQNASDTDTGFHMHCSHDSCKSEFNGDRWLFLDKACQEFGVEHASALLAFCENLTLDEEEEEQAQAETQSALDEAIGKLSAETPAAEVESTILLATQLTSPVERDRALERVREALGYPKVAFRDLVRATVEAAAMGGGDGINGFVDPHPVPDNPESASAIWRHWSHPDQCRVTLKRLLFLNRKNPTLFLRPDGTMIRLVMTPEGEAVESLDGNQGAWNFILTNYGIEYKRRDEEGNEESIAPFPNVLSYLAGAPKIEFPVLERVMNVPVFSAKGTLETKVGAYHPDAHIWLQKSADCFEVSTEPNDDEVADAVYNLMELLRDFAFSDCIEGVDPLPVKIDGEPNWERGKASRAHALGMMIEPFARNLIIGATPCYHIDKPERGSGASLLIEAVTYVTTGRAQAGQTYPHKDEELKKVITASLRNQMPYMIFDNVMTKVDSPDLPAAITQGAWTDRILGQSETVTIPIRCTWIIAGNRVTFNPDMVRRNVPIYIDPAVPNPAQRADSEFKYHPLMEGFVIPKRKALVWSIHTLIANWIAKGKKPGKAFMGSFESWSKTIGGILEAAGIDGFLETQKAYQEEANDENSAIVSVTQRVWDKVGGDEKTPAELLDILCNIEAAGNKLSAFGGGNEQMQIDPSLGLTLNTPNRTPSGLMTALGRVLKKDFMKATVKLKDGSLVAWENRRAASGNKYRIVVRKPAPVHQAA